MFMCAAFFCAVFCLGLYIFIYILEKFISRYMRAVTTIQKGNKKNIYLKRTATNIARESAALCSSALLFLYYFLYFLFFLLLI